MAGSDVDTEELKALNPLHYRPVNVALRGSHVKDQYGGCLVAYPHHLGRTVRTSRIQLQREVFSPRVMSLVMSLEGTMVLKAEQHSHICVPFIQVGKGSVECNRDCIMWICWGGMQIGVGPGCLG